MSACWCFQGTLRHQAFWGWLLFLLKLPFPDMYVGKQPLFLVLQCVREFSVRVKQYPNTLFQMFCAY